MSVRKAFYRTSFLYFSCVFFFFLKDFVLRSCAYAKQSWSIDAMVFLFIEHPRLSVWPLCWMFLIEWKCFFLLVVYDRVVFDDVSLSLGSNERAHQKIKDVRDVKMLHNWIGPLLVDLFCLSFFFFKGKSLSCQLTLWTQFAVCSSRSCARSLE